MITRLKKSGTNERVSEITINARYIVSVEALEPAKNGLPRCGISMANGDRFIALEDKFEIERAMVSSN